jgi:hypothetical protein
MARVVGRYIEYATCAQVFMADEKRKAEAAPKHVSEEKRARRTSTMASTIATKSFFATLKQQR